MKRFVFIAMGLVSLILCFAVGGTVLVLNSLSSTPPPGEEDLIVKLPAPQPNSKINILILGTDEGLQPGGAREPARTDTMMLASFNPATSMVNVLSLPRDSRVDIPGQESPDKLGHAHADGDIPLIVLTVENLLDLSIHYYVRVDRGGFRRLIDAIGGVDYYVERDMFYEDPYQDLFIDLKKGQQRLDGNKAEQYVRFRGDGSDIERIGRQQKFLMAAIKQVLRPANLLKVNQLFDTALRSVTTNFDAVDFLKFLPYLDGFSEQNVNTYLLAGDHAVIDGIWFWELNMEAVDEVLVNFWDDLRGNPGDVKVRIVDASGEELAETLAGRMERRGFIVVAVDEAEEPEEQTLITAHDNWDAAALMVYHFIGQGTLYKENEKKDVDVTLVLGKDMNR